MVCGWRTDPAKFELGIDLFLYAVDKKDMRNKGQTYLVRPEAPVLDERRRTQSLAGSAGGPSNVAGHVQFALGGYDGFDANLGYAARNIVPPGGDPAQSGPGEPVTAATIAAHVIAVDAFVEDWGTWQDAQPTWPKYALPATGPVGGFIEQAARDAAKARGARVRMTA